MNLDDLVHVLSSGESSGSVQSKFLTSLFIYAAIIIIIGTFLIKYLINVFHGEKTEFKSVLFSTFILVLIFFVITYLSIISGVAITGGGGILILLLSPFLIWPYVLMKKHGLDYARAVSIAFLYVLILIAGLFLVLFIIGNSALITLGIVI